MIDAFNEPSNSVHSIFFRLKLETSNIKIKIPGSRAALNRLISLTNKNMNEERSNSKNVFP